MKKSVSMVRLALVLCAMVVGLAACQKQAPAQESFYFTDVTGLKYAKDFSLLDFNGQPKTLASYKGKVVVMFFGFTQCPDVCPTTMTLMVQALKLMGDDAKKVQVLFVTVDPQRDTPAILKQYVPAFDPDFMGLYGDQAATDKFINDFKLYVKKVPGKTADDYTIDHTAGDYVFDKNGNIRLFMKNDSGPEHIAHDLKILVNE